MKVQVRLLRIPTKVMKPHNQNHWDRLMKIFDKNKSPVIEWAPPGAFLN